MYRDFRNYIPGSRKEDPKAYLLLYCGISVDSLAIYMPDWEAES